MTNPALKKLGDYLSSPNKEAPAARTRRSTRNF